MVDVASTVVPVVFGDKPVRSSADIKLSFAGGDANAAPQQPITIKTKYFIIVVELSEGLWIV